MDGRKYFRIIIFYTNQFKLQLNNRGFPDLISNRNSKDLKIIIAQLFYFLYGICLVCKVDYVIVRSLRLVRIEVHQEVEGLEREAC